MADQPSASSPWRPCRRRNAPTRWLATAARRIPSRSRSNGCARTTRRSFWSITISSTATPPSPIWATPCCASKACRSWRPPRSKTKRCGTGRRNRRAIRISRAPVSSRRRSSAKRMRPRIRPPGDALLRAYGEVHARVFEHLSEKLPRPAEMKPDAYERNLAARAFDVARYLLFWGVPTNVGQVTSIRTLEKQIKRLRASEYEELRSLGEEIAAGLRGRAGLHVGRIRRARAARAHARAPRRAGRVSDAIARGSAAVGRRRICRPRAGTAAGARRSAAARPMSPPRLWRRCSIRSPTGPSASSTKSLRGWSAARRAEVIDVALQSRSRRDDMLRAFPRRPVLLRHGDRHRRVSRPAPPSPLPAVPAGVQRAVWDSIRPRLVADAGATEHLSKPPCASAFDQMHAPARAGSHYLLPFGARSRFLFKMDFAEVEYICAGAQRREGPLQLSRDRLGNEAEDGSSWSRSWAG